MDFLTDAIAGFFGGSASVGWKVSVMLLLALAALLGGMWAITH